MSRLARLRSTLDDVELTRRTGVVRRMRGLAIESQGPRARVGELCAVLPPASEAAQGAQASLGGGSAAFRLFDSHAQADAHSHEGHNAGSHAGSVPVLAEVVGVQPGHVTLMPYGTMHGLAAGSTVLALGRRSTIGVGDELLGRVIDCFGRPLDGREAPLTTATRPIEGVPMNPLHRPRITRVLETGIRAIDGLLTLGQGQRVGIFAGSGVGKSTLLGMIAKHVKADVNVIALIGERGREVREFIDKQLGEEGLRRSVVVVATADQPALARARAAHAALAIAEHFRDEGKQVLLTMDSITRLAMARREIGLAAGEPPTARGYTPSVFAELPQLCERCGTARSGGAITALLTVLVEGDDFNEPVSDALRAILDGHIVLTRRLAHEGQYPAIDVLKSASRLLPDLTLDAERNTIREAVRVLAMIERNHQMIELGAYEAGTNPELDAALARRPALQTWLAQTEGGMARGEALRQLAQALGTAGTPSMTQAARTKGSAA
ncbi:FliI/YscN family ATPase [Trinickia fusca]|uniref:FliI/YscN family ATPase n=1 Tax=Trinickia fusca TaxID=2419777 RepID=A0A494XCA9_9BURK|nr:FliI/YscN family ATPase [Trinickia fusca]RKP48497.1 FliI/YscN family ATPase [Trinickia fusca]